MPSTFQALGVALLALLPGALYELAREQRSGRWGLRGADQLVRLLAFSVVFQVVIAPLTYWLYAHYIVTGHFRAGRPVGGWLWGLERELIPPASVPGWAARWTGVNALQPKNYDYLRGDDYGVQDRQNHWIDQLDPTDPSVTVRDERPCRSQPTHRRPHWLAKNSANTSMPGSSDRADGPTAQTLQSLVSIRSSPDIIAHCE